MSEETPYPTLIEMLRSVYAMNDREFDIPDVWPSDYSWEELERRAAELSARDRTTVATGHPMSAQRLVERHGLHELDALLDAAFVASLHGTKLR